MNLSAKIAVFLCLFPVCALSADTASDISGRISVKKHGKENWTVLHSTVGTAYRLTGDGVDQITKKSLELGEKNIFTIKGTADGGSTVSCEKKNYFETSASGEQTMKTETKCVRYISFSPSSIVSTAVSDAEMPPLTRDSWAEDNMGRENLTSGVKPPIIGEIYGTVTGANFRAPIKTVEIKNNDSKSPLRSATLLITDKTKIIKKNENNEAAGMPPEYLKNGQKVTAVYTNSGTGLNALFITITAE